MDSIIYKVLKNLEKNIPINVLSGSIPSGGNITISDKKILGIYVGASQTGSILRDLDNNIEHNDIRLYQFYYGCSEVAKLVPDVLSNGFQLSLNGYLNPIFLGKNIVTTNIYIEPKGNGNIPYKLYYLNE